MKNMTQAALEKKLVRRLRQAYTSLQRGDPPRAVFDVGVQHISLHSNSTKAEAEWTRDMLAKALSNFLEAERRPKGERRRWAVSCDMGNISKGLSGMVYVDNAVVVAKAGHDRLLVDGILIDLPGNVERIKALPRFSVHLEPKDFHREQAEDCSDCGKSTRYWLDPSTPLCPGCCVKRNKKADKEDPRS